MSCSVLNLTLFILGFAIVVCCVVLFVQCHRIVEDNLVAENRFAQVVLSDVIRSAARRNPNGIKPEDLRRALYTRVSAYTMVGLCLVGVGWARQRGPWSSRSNQT